MPESKQDRELIELLNELRVVLPGVQVLFAFLLTVPFTQYFPKVTDSQKNVYFAALLLTAVATAFLIAPTAFHRIRWRDRDKEYTLEGVQQVRSRRAVPPWRRLSAASYG